MIGLFDSGIGGLTVVRELLRQAPDASFIYLGDTANLPYGNKSPDTIRSYARADAAFLVAQGVDSIVIACNTASAHAADLLRELHPSVPIFDVIVPAVEDALAVTRGRVGVIGTRGTIGSGIYQKKLSDAKKDIEVLAQACPLFVPLVEEGWLNDPETKRIVKRYLSPLRSRNVDTLILGCTHYPLLAPVIKRYMGNRVTLVDSAASVIRRVVNAGIERSADPVQRYFLTDVSPHSVQIAQTWLGRPIRFETAVLS